MGVASGVGVVWGAGVGVEEAPEDRWKRLPRKLRRLDVSKNNQNRFFISLFHTLFKIYSVLQDSVPYLVLHWL